MSKMRGGFKSMIPSSNKKADPKQFIYILAGLFVLFGLVFFGTR